MAARRTLISLDEARDILLRGVGPLGPERVPLAESTGRILAADIVATRDQPPNSVSAMDGYAVAGPEIEVGAVFEVVGDAPAGRPFNGCVERGKAVRIATGGVVPDGAERVVVQEIVEREGDQIRLLELPGSATFIRPRGCDFRIGETIARAGDVLTPGRIGLVAAANLAEVEASVRPRVLILASGDELREPGSALAPGVIVNSASYALSGLIEAWGGVAVRAPILSDERERCRSQIEQARPTEFDLIVPLGGASVGDRDVLRPVIEGLGATVLFDRIAIQPGKPCWHARFDDGPMVVGLPGNPASAFVCAHLLIQPLLMALLGRSNSADLIKARLKEPMPAGSSSREVYWRATLESDGQGSLLVVADPRLDSSLQLPLASANALIRRPVGAEPAAAGALVDVLQIGPLD